MSDHFILIGHPVGHSVSPAIHGRAYELLGRSAVYTLEDAPNAEAVRALVERLRSGELRGANVTVPWKQLALELADEVDPSARAVGAANVLGLSPSGRLVAHNSDAWALGAELRATSPRPGAALVLGSGGAALAAVVSCQLAGLDEVRVTARRFDPALPPEQWPLASQWQRLGAQMVAWPGLDADCWRGLSAIVQATSAGMKGAPGGVELAAIVPWERLEPVVAYDLIYNPPRTPFLERAEATGHHAVGGLGMLVGQAARAIEIWWGTKPAEAPLLSAARAALGI